MVIANRDAVVAGIKLVATHKKQAYVCTVEAGEDGKLAFVYDGKSYNSPSSAGAAVIGGACNGWRFWAIQCAETAASPLRASRTRSARTDAGRKPARARNGP